MSEFGFRDTNNTSSFNRFSFPSDTSITASMVGNNGEGVSNLLDNNVNTKYCSSNRPTTSNPDTIIINLGDNTIDLETYKYYYYYIANDRQGQRNPITWKLYASVDGEEYIQIDERTNVSVNTALKSLAGIWQITIS